MDHRMYLLQLFSYHSRMKQVTTDAKITPKSSFLQVLLFILLLKVKRGKSHFLIPP